MQFDNRILAAAMALAFLAGAFSIIGSDADADPEISRDYGEFYSYTLQFVFDGAEAQTIDWDFGDGSEHSGEWNPRHTYASTGTFFITQTTENPKGTTVEVYKVQIMGFPILTFDSAGGSVVSGIQMDSYNGIASQPEDPVRDGYVFGGWYCEPTCDNPMDWTSGITRSMTLYAEWIPAEEPVVYHTVTFDSNGGSAVQTQVVQSRGTATQPSDPVRTGFTFNGWLLDGTTYDFTVPVVEDITLMASWTENTAPIVDRTVSFNVDGGSAAVDSMTVADGSSMTLPAYTGTKSGYAFSGWTYNSTTFQPGQSFNVTSDVTFKAIWRSTAPVVTEITVTFNVDGGSRTVPSQTIQSGSAFTFPAYDGTKADCTFGGWACGLQIYQPGQSITLTGDVTVKAIWNTASGGDDSGSGSGDIAEDIKDVLMKNILIVIVIIVLVLLTAFYVRSRRRY